MTFPIDERLRPVLAGVVGAQGQGGTSSHNHLSITTRGTALYPTLS